MSYREHLTPLSILAKDADHGDRDSLITGLQSAGRKKQLVSADKTTRDSVRSLQGIKSTN